MIRTKRLYTRGGKLYIDSYTEYGRVRIATGCEDSRANRKNILANIDDLIYKHIRGDGKKAGSLKLRDLSDELIKSLSHIKQTSRQAYVSMANTIIGALGNKDIRLFSTHNVGSFFESRSPKFEKFFNRLIALANEKNPELNLKPLKIKHIRVLEENEEIEPFNLEEMRLILWTASIPTQPKDAQKKQDLLTYLYIAFLTGARTGEILALNWEDIDFENDKIAITKSLNESGEITSPKTKSSVRHIDMLEPLKAYLSQHKSSGTIIRSSRMMLRREFYTLLDSLGIKFRVLYNTRHTFASLMLSNGEEPLWVAAMLGHKNLNITYSHYAKFIPQKSRARAVFLNDGFLGGNVWK